MAVSDSQVNDLSDSIVITGAGLITSLGLSRRAVWQAIRAGKDGIAPLRAVESHLDPNKGGGEAPPIPEANDLSSRREVTYLRKVIAEALREARMNSESPDGPQRSGIILGTTLHGMRQGGQFLRTGDFGHLRGFLAGAVLRAGTSAAGRTFGGLTASTCSACSSGLASISLACTVLRSGEVDCMLAGGYDAISEYAYAGFNSMRLVSGGEIRPFSRYRDGMKVAEGYGVVVLEREHDARRRGARILARIAGIGESCDSFHLSKPHPEGAGAANAMLMALNAAGVNEVDLVVAHATATPDNDAAEYAALRQVFADRLPEVPVVAFKSYFGHTLGGAGAVELICALSAMEDGVCPPCLHVTRGDVAYEGLALTIGTTKSLPLRKAMCTSLGFGGANVAIVLESPAVARQSAPTARTPVRSAITGPSDVLVTGIGLLLPNPLDIAASGGDDPADPSAFHISDARIEELLNAKRVRRMSRYAKLSLAAAALALRDAQLAQSDPLSHGGAILATTHGSSAFCAEYYRQIIAEGPDAANPLLFSEGVPNVAAAHISTAFGIRGFCQTLIGTRTAGVDALRLAAARVRSGQWPRALVVAAEEHHEVVNAAYRENWGRQEKKRGAKVPFITSEGAVAFILERRDSLGKRDVKPWGEIMPMNRGDENLGGNSHGLGDVVHAELTAIFAHAKWSWGRRERIAARKALRRLAGRSGGQVECLPDHWPELFSAGPLAALGRWLLAGRTVSNGAATHGMCVACDHDGNSSTVFLSRALRG